MQKPRWQHTRPIGCQPDTARAGGSPRLAAHLQAHDCPHALAVGNPAQRETSIAPQQALIAGSCRQGGSGRVPHAHATHQAVLRWAACADPGRRAQPAPASLVQVCGRLQAGADDEVVQDAAVVHAVLVAVRQHRRAHALAHDIRVHLAQLFHPCRGRGGSGRGRAGWVPVETGGKWREQAGSGGSSGKKLVCAIGQHHQVWDRLYRSPSSLVFRMSVTSGGWCSSVDLRWSAVERTRHRAPAVASSCRATPPTRAGRTLALGATAAGRAAAAVVLIDLVIKAGVEQKPLDSGLGHRATCVASAASPPTHVLRANSHMQLEAETPLQTACIEIVTQTL